MGLFDTLRARWQLDLMALRRVAEDRGKIEQRLAQEAERLLREATALRRPHHGSGRLVMGLAANYGVAELAPFVRSLRGAGYTGDIALLTYGCTAETASFLRQYRVRMVPFTGLGAMPMSMNSARMFRYLDWLIELHLNSADGGNYGRIFLTDVRDVVFQGDPFASVPDERLSFFLETERTLGSCPVNSEWLRRAYGPAMADTLKAHRVSCAGTLMGRPDALLEYLAHMVRDICGVPVEHRFSGVDQAIHNVILAQRRVAGSVTVENGGPVMTVPTAKVTGMRVREDGVIVNAEGHGSEVVHQYDRDANLLQAIEARYAR